MMGQVKAISIQLRYIFKSVVTMDCVKSMFYASTIFGAPWILMAVKYLPTDIKAL
jgi:uncharacterized membrane protein